MVTPLLANFRAKKILTTMDIPTIVARRNKYKENKPVAIQSAISNAQNNRSPKKFKN